ncbi:hypothetical protein BJV77DRAFT_749534 [Russula vinacea]|nr:hypothetical protein BJV77DRAFT_749534 [Russula vinacea]
MEAAAMKDRSILIRLPLTVEKPKITVEFLIHRSLLDPKPTIVKLVLDHHSGFSEVLWIFGCLRDDSEMRRLTLEQNPHFYPRLPTLPEAYEGNFRMEPIGTFQQERVSVLIDNPNHAGQVFLETERETRTFGNVWVPNETIIFKDVCGSLVGESIVEAAIDGIPNIWSFEEPLRRPLPSRSPNRNNPSLTVTATQITSAEGMLIRDWREPIRQMLQSRDVYVRITDKPPSSSSASYSYAS